MYYVFFFIILIYNIRLNYNILVFKSYSSQNILFRIGHDNQWMSVHHTFIKYRIQVLVYFQQHKRPQWSKKKLKQLSKHTAYTLLTHIKRNIHYYIFNPKTTDEYIKIRSFKIMQPICSKLPLQREKIQKGYITSRW